MNNNNDYANYSLEDTVSTLHSINTMIESFAMTLDESTGAAMTKESMVSFLYLVHEKQASLLNELGSQLYPVLLPQIPEGMRAN